MAWAPAVSGMPVKTLVYRIVDAELARRIEHAMRKGLGMRDDGEEWLVAVFPTQTGSGWDLAVHGRRLRAFRTLSAREAANLPAAIEDALPEMLAARLDRTA